MAAVALSKFAFPKRQSYLNKGRQINLQTNFFMVTHIPNCMIYQYDVSIVPEIPFSKCRDIFSTWENENKNGILRDIMPVYDGRNSFFTPAKLPMKGDSEKYDLKVFEKDDPGKKGRPQSFVFTIKKVGEINMNRLHMFLNAQLTECPFETIMALDVVLRNKPSLIYTPVGRCFFNRDNYSTAFGGVEFWRGYHQSIRPGKRNLYVNLDIAAATFHEPISVVDIVAKCIGRDSGRDLRNPLSDKDLQKVERHLKNLRFITTHRGDKKRKYKISGLTRQPANQLKFKIRDTEEEDTVANYFSNRYNINLYYPYLPCLIANNPKKHIYIPMEVCKILEGQRFTKKLNDKQTADMIKFTCQPPNVRSKTILNGIDILSNPMNTEYQEAFGLKFNTRMTEVKAHVLPGPSVYYHPNSSEKTIRPESGKWNLKNKILARCNSFDSWSVVVFLSENRFSPNNTMGFIQNLSSTCTRQGMSIPKGNPPIMNANPNGNIQKILSQSYQDAVLTYKKPPQLILCILPDTKVQLYSEIKRVADTILGVPTQCVQSNKAQKANPMYCANVSLKMNVKLGGINSYLGGGQLSFIAEKPTMVFGADVTHPPPGGDPNRVSIVSVVGSMDAQCARYAASLRTQQGRIEIIQDIKEMVIELLRAFYKSTGAKPERLLFYRDGVSEGQFNEVLRSEIPEIQKACEELDQTYHPTLTYIIVQKRHHARFFPINRDDQDRSGNILPGTVIDDTITHPSCFDFYLCSHSGLQGTSKPSHYFVLYDENNFNSESLQTLTYNMCYLYCRATCSVSIPPPVYYSHLAAARARYHLQGDGWDEIESDISTIASLDPNSASYTIAPVLPNLRKVMYFM